MLPYQEAPAVLPFQEAPAAAAASRPTFLVAMAARRSPSLEPSLEGEVRPSLEEEVRQTHPCVLPEVPPPPAARPAWQNHQVRSASHPSALDPGEEAHPRSARARADRADASAAAARACRALLRSRGGRAVLPTPSAFPSAAAAAAGNPGGAARRTVAARPWEELPCPSRRAGARPPRDDQHPAASYPSEEHRAGLPVQEDASCSQEEAVHLRGTRGGSDQAGDGRIASVMRSMKNVPPRLQETPAGVGRSSTTFLSPLQRRREETYRKKRGATPTARARARGEDAPIRRGSR